MCNSIKNLIQKSKKEPINPKELVAMQESRRKMSDNPVSLKHAQQDLQKASLKLDKDAESSAGGSPTTGRTPSVPEQRESTDVESINNDLAPNIPVIDENDDSSSSYSLAEKL